MTPQYEAKLLVAVEKEPRSLALPFSNWTTSNLAAYTAQQTAIVISPRQVEHYLKVHGEM